MNALKTYIVHKSHYETTVEPAVSPKTTSAAALLPCLPSTSCTVITFDFFQKISTELLEEPKLILKRKEMVFYGKTQLRNNEMRNLFTQHTWAPSTNDIILEVGLLFIFLWWLLFPLLYTTLLTVISAGFYRLQATGWLCKMQKSKTENKWLLICVKPHYICRGCPRKLFNEGDTVLPPALWK